VIWLLDAATIIYAMNGAGRCRQRLNSAPTRGRVATSLLAVAELYYGAQHSKQRQANYARVERELELLDIYPVTKKTAHLYAEIREEVEQAGRPKGERGAIDLLLAATAIEHDAVLVTRDGDLLDRAIPRLRVEDWY
jgi:predicted nucleic acid-binding protein